MLQALGANTQVVYVNYMHLFPLHVQHSYYMSTSQYHWGRGGHMKAVWLKRGSGWTSYLNSEWKGARSKAWVKFSLLQSAVTTA